MQNQQLRGIRDVFAVLQIVLLKSQKYSITVIVNNDIKTNATNKLLTIVLLLSAQKNFFRNEIKIVKGNKWMDKKYPFLEPND